MSENVFWLHFLELSNFNDEKRVFHCCKTPWIDSPLTFLHCYAVVVASRTGFWY